MKVVSAEVMQQIDAEAIHSFGIPGVDLMERAGQHCAETVMVLFAAHALRKALVVAGKGNNGGDGYVIARLLHGHGWQIDVMVLAQKDDIGGDAAINLQRLPASVTVAFCPDEESFNSHPGDWSGYGVLIDALFGTGLKQPVTGVYLRAIEAMNAAQVPVVAVDIPSGIHGTSGKILGKAVRADVTVTFACAKLGHILYPGAEHAGDIRVVDIGIPDEITARAPGFEFVDQHHARGLVRPRKRDSHKGTFGHCLIIAGSTGHTGAAAMTAASAVRSGSGLVTLGIPESLNAVLEVKTTESMTLPFVDHGRGYLGGDAAEAIIAASQGKDVVALGPGLSWCTETTLLVHQLVQSVTLPLVVDADGLNCLSADPSVLLGTSSPLVVITPHPGEMARLTGVTVAEVESDRIASAVACAGRFRVMVVLKGARTVIAAPDGRVSINGSGNPGMASGGMGDVLTGLIASLLGQRYEPLIACQLGVFIHGHAGDLVAREKGEVGITAMDVVEKIPYAFKDLQQVVSSYAI